jgi:dihydroorotate dehydrogenase
LISEDRPHAYLGLRYLDLVDHLLKTIFNNNRRLLVLELGLRDPRSLDKWFEQGVNIQAGHQTAILQLAAKHGIEPVDFCDGPALWHYKDSLQETLARKVNAVPEHPQPFLHHSIDLWGERIKSPLGAAANVITASPNHIRWLFANGVDTIVFKTVLPREQKPFNPGNFYYAREANSPPIVPETAAEKLCMPVQMPSESLRAVDGLLKRAGLFSLPPQEWIPDFQLARSYAAPGQLLILSVAGAAEERDGEGRLIDDYTRCAEMAVAEAGAAVLEVHLSSITSSGLENFAYRNPQLAKRICESVRKAVPQARLVAKIGYLPASALTELVKMIGPHVDGIAGINAFPVAGTISGDRGGSPAYHGNAVGGYSGAPIRLLALDFAKEMRRICNSCPEAQHLVIFGQGGIHDPDSAMRMLKYADFVMAATAFLDDSYFGVKVRRRLDGELHNSARSQQADEREYYTRHAEALVLLRADVHPSRFPAIMTAATGELEAWVSTHKVASASPLRSGNRKLPSVEELRQQITRRYQQQPAG